MNREKQRSWPLFEPSCSGLRAAAMERTDMNPPEGGAMVERWLSRPMMAGGFASNGLIPVHEDG